MFLFGRQLNHFDQMFKLVFFTFIKQGKYFTIKNLDISIIVQNILKF